MTMYPEVKSLEEAVNFVNNGKSFDLNSDGDILNLSRATDGFWGYDNELGIEQVFASDNKDCITRLTKEFQK